MELLKIRGQDMREALERASAEVGRDALVVSRRVEDDGTVVLEVAPGPPSRKSPAGKPRSFGRAAKGDLLDLDVRRRLGLSGVSDALAERICRAVADRMGEKSHPLDLAAEVIGGMFPVASLSRVPASLHVFALLGQSGVGKTTVLLKLAARLARRGRSLALATLDTKRKGSLESWRSHAQALRLPFLALREAVGLVREEGRLEGTELLLLDTGGDVSQDVAQLVRLCELLEGRARRWSVSVSLVFSAASSPSTMDALSEAAAALHPGCAVLTKLDETNVPGPLLEHVLRRELPVAFLSNDPEIAAGFHRPKGDHFADLLLSGRLR